MRGLVLLGRLLGDGRGWGRGVLHRFTVTMEQRDVSQVTPEEEGNVEG